MNDFNPNSYTHDELDTALDLLTMLEKYCRTMDSVADVLHLLHNVKMGVFKESIRQENEMLKDAFNRLNNPPV